MLCTLYVGGRGDMSFKYKNLVISDTLQYDKCSSTKKLII